MAGTAASLALAFGWVGSSFLIMRPVKALVRASARLATGDLSSRTGLRHGKDELGQLTRTFDQMAQALEQRELERQLAEETLQTRDTMIRELPLLPAAICVCDRFGAVELYNRTAVELWGCEPPDLHGGRQFCGSYLLFHPDGTPMPHSDSPMAEVLRTGAPLRNRELVIGRPNGTLVPVLANVVPLRDSKGSMIGAVSCLQDITERKRAEERLKESNEKLQLLSRRLVESQETERRHIARELHDEVGPNPHRGGNEPPGRDAVFARGPADAALEREPAGGRARARTGARSLAQLAPVDARRPGTGVRLAVVHQSPSRADRAAG